MRIEAVEITAQASALTDPAEGQLAQAADLLQGRTVGCGIEQEDLAAIGGGAQRFRMAQRSPHLARRQRMRDRAGGGEHRRLAAPHPVHVHAHALGDLPRRKRGRLQRLGLHRRTDGQGDALAARQENLTRQQQGGQRL
jgi:hypothetical protein